MTRTPVLPFRRPGSPLLLLTHQPTTPPTPVSAPPTGTGTTTPAADWTPAAGVRGCTYCAGAGAVLAVPVHRGALVPAAAVRTPCPCTPLDGRGEVA